MKLLVAQDRLYHRRAATLVEFMVAMLTMTIAVGAILSAYMYGMRTTEFIRPKLLASDDARKMISLITDEIRSANDINVGNATLSSFTSAAANTLQQGNAIQIYPGTNSNVFVRYFVDAVDKRLKRTTNNVTARVIAESVTNRVVFAFEDYTGKTLTTKPGTIIVGMNLHFFTQFRANTNSLGFYDNYRLSTKATRRIYVY
ncbi:MAG TPA: hypothetical protein VK530_05715 [Candidatus Acidoferrum sp.]|nr:hypothetical protein [Candidatus Acidoferrum sp.]